MNNILVSIEAGHEARTRSAVDEAIRLHREEAADVYLLLVQPRVSCHVATFFSPDDLHEAQWAWARDDLQPAQAQLDRARVP